MEEVEKFSRGKNFKKLFCSKWAKKPKKQHVFFHIWGVGQKQMCNFTQFFFWTLPLHIQWIITSCVEELLKQVHVFIMKLGIGQITEKIWRGEGLSMWVGEDQMVNLYWWEDLLQVPQVYLLEEVKAMRNHQKWCLVLVLKRVLT